MNRQASSVVSFIGQNLNRVIGPDGLRKSRSSPLIRVMVAYFGANILGTAVQVVSGLLVARWAGPKYMGYFLAVSVVLPYLRFISLGTINATARQLPLLKGQGKHEEASRIVNTVWWWMRGTGTLAGFAFLVVGGVLIARGERFLGSSCIAHSLLVPLEHFSGFHRVTYRTSGDFMKLSRIRLINSGLALLTVFVLLVSPWWGLLARAILLGGSQYFLLRLWQSIQVRPSLDREKLGQVMRIGVPMFGLGYLQNIYKGLDRTLVLLFLGTQGVGLYTPALQIARAAIVFPMSIDQILYPRMCAIYGKTNTARNLARVAFLPALGLSVGLIPIVLIGWVLVEPFFNIVLPEYAEGIPAARWMLVLFYARSISTSRIVLTVLYKLRIAAICVVLAGLVSIGLTALLYSVTSMGLAAIPAGCAGGAFFYGIANTLVALYYMFGKPRKKEARA